MMNHKLLKFFRHDTNVIATFYGQIQYPPSQVCMFRKNGLNSLDLIAHGSMLSLDPKRTSLKRILLTGNPHKINKRRAVVRYMFFDPSDIKYYKPIDIFTKKGLRGNILKALGTHGIMKCAFNEQIGHDDTVFLPLYKRVYPQWIPGTWTLNVSGYEKSEIDLTPFKRNEKKPKEIKKEDEISKTEDQKMSE